MLNHQIISRANAENLTDADMQAIKAVGLRVVQYSDIDEVLARQVMRRDMKFVSAEVS